MLPSPLFDPLVQLVSSTSVAKAPGKLIYSCRMALKQGHYYLVGFNPGGDPLAEDQTVLEHLLATPEGPWSEYTRARWVLNKKLREPGKQNRQTRVQRWAAEVGIDLERTFCTNVLFARGATVHKTRADPRFDQYLRDCASIHGFMIEGVRPKKVLCFGVDAFETFRRIEQSDEFVQMTARSSKKDDYKIIRLPHFSLRCSDDDFVEMAVRATLGEETASEDQRDYWPVVILQDRYGGTYSRGKWLALASADGLENGAYRIVRCLEAGPFGDDTEAIAFWAEPPHWIAVGDTPDQALHALYARKSSGDMSADMTHER
jgi:hypothetical protein